MALEIRQMVVKSNVQSTPEPNEEEVVAAPPEYDEIRKSILDACKSMVVEMLRQEKER